MTHYNHIDDEMLARYLSGLSSYDEEAAILDAVGSDAELEADLLHIADAVAMQRRYEQEQSAQPGVILPFVAAAAAQRPYAAASTQYSYEMGPHDHMDAPRVHAQMAYRMAPPDQVAAQRPNEEKQRAQAVTRRRIILSLAAMLVVVLVSGVVYLTVRSLEKGNFVAENYGGDPVIVAEANEEEVRIIDQNTMQPLPQAPSNSFDESGERNSSPGSNKYILPSSNKYISPSSSKKELRLNNKTADYESLNKAMPDCAEDNFSIAEELKVLSPRQREVVNRGESVTFRFHYVGGSCTLVVTDASGREIVHADVTGKESYTLTSGRYGSTGSLSWTLTHVASDGSVTRRTGTIQLVD